MTVSEKIASVPRWRHRIALPDGHVTPGTQDTFLQLERIHLPTDLSGASVLDIGCSDGFYSFECERRGAARILAVDNFSSVYIDSPSGFHVAREVLGSKVEFMKADLFSLDASQLGRFDLVLFLGVLYHLRHPLLGMERLAPLVGGQLIMETEVADRPVGALDKLMAALTRRQVPDQWMEFYAAGEINRDPTTWWAPTTACAEAMLASCGFCAVKTVSNIERRGVLHAFTPRAGDEPARLVSEYGQDLVTAGVSYVLNRPVAANEVEGMMKKMSVPEFGTLKQHLAEMRAKQWHQKDRHQSHATITEAPSAPD